MIENTHLRLLVALGFFCGSFGLSAGAEPPLSRMDAGIERKIASSYRVLTPVEPDISEVELALLQKAEDLLSTNPTFAELMLEGIVSGQHPSSATFNHVLANIYFEKGDWQKAEVQYREAVRKYDRFRRAWNSLGILLYRQDRFTEAAEALVRSVDLGENDAYTFGLLGYCHLRADSYRAAEIAYDMAILKEPDNTDWLEGKAQVLAEMGRMGEARFLLDELIRGQPSNARYWMAQANSWMERGDFLAAVRNLEIARLLGQESPETLFALGGAYLHLGMNRNAAAVYREAMAHSTIIDFRQALRVARLLLSVGETEEARAIFDQIDVEADGWRITDRVNYRFLAADLERAADNQEAAISHLVWVTERDPLNGEGLIRLGRIYLEADRPAEAQVVLGRVRRESSARFGALMLLSKIMVDQKRYADALPLVQEALSLRPGAALNTLYLQVKEASESAAAFSEELDRTRAEDLAEAS